jgi:IPT/TIG domain
MRLATTIALLMLLQGAAGCDQQGVRVTAPTPAQLAFRVTAVTPTVGLVASSVAISGMGFLSGATVTLGTSATNVQVVDSTIIIATTPLDGAGTVDVIVTNPDGQTAVLAGAFGYGVVTLTPSSTVITPGSRPSVNWVAPSGRSRLDWVGFYRVGDPNVSIEFGFWEYTSGAPSGSWTLSAPARPGQYEFRYLLDDFFFDVARSVSVTVR